jgi:hypothetical protein
MYSDEGSAQALGFNHSQHASLNVMIQSFHTMLNTKNSIKTGYRKMITNDDKIAK